MKMRTNIKDYEQGYVRYCSMKLGLLPMKLGLLFSVVFFLLAIIPATLRAQITAGSINGQVRDPSQGTVPGATVTVKNTATSATRTALTTQDGRYTFSQLIPGEYVITVSAAGFATYQHSNLLLQASQALELNPQLTVGAVSEQVVVNSEPSLLNTEDANSNVTFSTKALLDLPISSHSSLGAVWATGGVVSVHTGMNGNGPITGDNQQNRFALAGGRDMASAILVDGISVTAGDWGGAIGLPAADMVSENHVYQNTFDTQYGKTDGGVVSVTTRGGSDAFHASAFEYYQSQALNANTWNNDFAGVAKTPYTINLYGGHLSGPAWRSKHIYFFGNYQGTRNSSPATLLTTVPTQAERQGDFTGDASTDGTFSPIYNPFSTVQAGGTYARQPFATPNVIPASLIDPIGQTIANLYPLPNRAGVQNYAASSTNLSTMERVDVRGDWAPIQKFSMYGTFMHLNYVSGAPVFFGHGLDTGATGESPTYRILLSGTYVPSPTFVVNITGATARWNQESISPGTKAGTDGSIYNLPQSLISQFPINTPPVISLETYQTLGNGRSYFYKLYNNDFQVNATKTLNSHTIRFGYQMTVQLLNDYNQNSGSFSLNRGMTSGPTAATDSGTSGDSIASLLLGTMSSSQVVNAVVPAATQKYAAVYGEDAWKITNRLTLNYGGRYEIQFGRTERHNRYNYFDANAVNPLSQQTGLNLKGGLVYANSNHRGLWDTDYKNVSPRIGIAYQAAPNVIFHLGYGLYYLQTISSDPTGNSDGFSVTTNGNASVNNSGFVPQDLISNPFPSGLLQPIGSSQGLLTEAGNSVNAIFLKHPTPYQQTYTANIQWQTPNNATVEIGYQGSQGRRLPIGYGTNIDQLPSQYLSQGAALNNKVANPFKGLLPTSSSLSGATIPANQLLRPYPQFTSVNNSQDQPGASSGYNALLASYTQRVRGGLTAAINYRWSKAIDNTSETGYNSDAARDVYNLSLERSVSAHDVPQYFTGTVVWELPFGRGKRFGSNINRVADIFTGGWQLSTITNLNTGFPVQFSCPNTLSSYGYAVCRPNIPNVPALRQVKRSLTQWFNTAAVTAPGSYTIGNAPRYLSNVRTGSLERSDVTARKSFVLTGEKTVSIHMSAFNISNTPFYGAPGASVGGNTFGHITGTGPGAISRTVEFGGRFTF